MQFKKIHLILLSCAILLMGQSACSQGHLNNNNSNRDHPTNTEIKKQKSEERLDSSFQDDTQLSIELEGEKLAEEQTLNNISITRIEKNIPSKKELEKKDRHAKDKNQGMSPPPPAKMFRVRLHIQNNNDYAMWYLMPSNGAVTLPADGRFHPEPTLVSGNKTFSARRYLGVESEGQLIELLFTGLPNQHFKAFYLPAKGSLTLSNYTIDCWQEADKVEFWAVRQLLVNDQKALDEWLPYSVLSSSNITVKCDKELGCKPELIEKPEAGGQAQPPGDKINFIQARKVSKYTIQLNAQ